MNPKLEQTTLPRRNDPVVLGWLWGDRQLAVRIHEFGGLNVMRIEEVPQPSPDSDEVLIKVLAASVNPVDAKIREGKYPPITPADLPNTLGRDAAGEIVAIGDKVEGYAVGQLIYVFLDPKRGGYQEYVLRVCRRLRISQPRSMPFRRREFHWPPSRRGRVFSAMED